MSTLNKNYKIPEKTLNSLSAAIDRLGFEDAFDIALERSILIIVAEPESIIITEYLSWSHNLTTKAECCNVPEDITKYKNAAAFYRKLSHHVYWAARRKGLIDYNPSFIQAV